MVKKDIHHKKPKKYSHSKEFLEKRAKRLKLKSIQNKIKNKTHKIKKKYLHHKIKVKSKNYASNNESNKDSKNKKNDSLNINFIENISNSIFPWSKKFIEKECNQMDKKIRKNEKIITASLNELKVLFKKISKFNLSKGVNSK